MAWKLTEAMCWFLKGWDARTLYRMAGRINEENTDPTANLTDHPRTRPKCVGLSSETARRMLMREKKPYVGHRKMTRSRR